MISLFIGCLLITKASNANQSPAGQVIIEGHYEMLKDDTVTLQFFKNKYGPVNFGAATQTRIIHDGKFRFAIQDVFGPSYIIASSNALDAKLRYIFYLDGFLIEPGDSIHIDIKKNGLIFSGKGSEKFKCRYAIDTVNTVNPYIHKKFFSLGDIKQDVLNGLAPLSDDYGMDVQLSMLENYRQKLSNLAFQLLKCDILCNWARIRYNVYEFRWGESFGAADSTARKKILIRFCKEKLEREPAVDDDVKMISKGYADFCVMRATMDSKIEDDKMELNDCSGPYRLLKSLPKPMRDKAIVSFLALMTEASGIAHYDSCVLDAIKSVEDNGCLAILHILESRNIKGANSFDFDLPDNNNKRVTLRSLKGKVVLMDFWFTGCDACLSCARQLRKVIMNFEGDDKVVFISVCTDQNIVTWKKSLAKETYASPELETNLFTEGKGINHPLLAYYNIVSFPTLLLIGQDGRLVSAVPPRPDEFNGVRKLTALITSTIGNIDEKANGH